MKNVDLGTVEGFGEEWATYDQSELSVEELRSIFKGYFAIFPWEVLPTGAVGFDAGCGSGRWAKFVAPRVGHLHCVDASPAALEVAKRSLGNHANCAFHLASVNEMPFADEGMDFGYSLGVLHHVPDPSGGLGACVRKLKPGAPFLLYLYYAFENRPKWFKAIWRASDMLRRMISNLPFRARRIVTEIIAVTVYWPLAHLARACERAGVPVDLLPLSAYRFKSFYTMRTDAFDRFGTRLERRFTRGEIHDMMTAAGLEHITFSEAPPFWCAVGLRKGSSEFRVTAVRRPGLAEGIDGMHQSNRDER